MPGPHRPHDPFRAARDQQRLIEIDAAMRRGDMDRAGALAEAAIAAGLEQPALLNLAAMRLYGQGRFEAAAGLLARARRMAPADPHVLNALGLCLEAAGRGAQALEAYDAAVRADPRHAAAQHNRADALEAAGDLEGARQGYARAAEIQPDYAEPLAKLAWLAAQGGDAEEAVRLSARVLALQPGHGLARLARAAAAIQSGRPAAAEAELLTLIGEGRMEPVNASIALGLLGDARDGLDRPAEAFAAYREGNAALTRLYAPRFEAADAVSPMEQIRRIADYFEAAPAAAWARTPETPAAADEPRAHVFLVGFPRSGTTLMEAVLAAHPDVDSLEEKNLLGPAADRYLTSARGLERLAALGAKDAAAERAAYWRAVRGLGVRPAGRVFIDKMPLATVHLPLIAKLFPKARILMARRDPRDVVLSCFRRRFGMNPSMYQLLTLEGAAGLYDGVMRLAEIYGRRLPLATHVLRYEDLVERFEETAREACSFIGLDWSEDLHDFAARARGRAINTPSAAQVARGLNREGAGAWRRYQAELAPVLPLLQPWAERFGYPLD